MIRVDTERFFPGMELCNFRNSSEVRQKGEAEWLRQYAKCGWRNRNSNPS
jgi:hypothetical protein